MRTPARVALALATIPLVLAILSVASSRAAAQDGGSQEAEPQPFAIVSSVDGRGDDVEVMVLADDYAVSRSEVTVVEAGEEIAGTQVETVRGVERLTEIVYVIDIANRSAVDGHLANVSAAIADSIAELPDEVLVGVVTAGREADVLTRLSNDRAKVVSGLQGISVDEQSVLVDGVALAAESFSTVPGAARTIVVVTSGADGGSTASVAAAQSGLVQNGVQLVTVAAPDAGSELADIVAGSGGVALTYATPDDVAASIGAATSAAADRLLVSFDGSTEAGQRSNVVLTIGDLSVPFSYPAGVLTVSTLQLLPQEIAAAADLGFFGQPIVLYASVGLAFVAIATALWILGSMYAGGETSLDKVLARYSNRDETLEDEEVQDMLVQTALIRRAIDMTETFAESRGFLTRIEELLERANIPVRAGEALFFLSAVIVVVFGLSMVVLGSIFLAGALALIAAVGGYATVLVLAKRRLAQFEEQLPDALQLLAGTLRAGYSLPQGLDAVSQEIGDPMGQELRRAITETQLGRELEESLTAIAERLDSPDFAWAVMAIGIQREVGGNLSEVLMTVADTMIQRERLRREVNALTAEGRVSAFILSMMPPGLGVVMYVMNPEYVGVLFSRTIGLILIGLAVVSGLVGLVWMKKVITIDA